MANPAEKLAQSLEVLKELQTNGIIAIRSSDLTRTHRERLLTNGFIQEVMKGWYIPSRQDQTKGESTAWYASFWDFCAAYLTERFGDDWSLSPEQSLSLHAGNRTVPNQLLVRATKARNKITNLLHESSIFEVRANQPEADETGTIDGLRVFSPVSALISCAPGFYKENPTDVRTALGIVADASDILVKLLDGGHSTVAGRLAGAFRNIGRDRVADDILSTMKAAGYTVRETDPFDAIPTITLSSRERSPYVNRVRLMWAEMREDIIGRFPDAPGLPEDTQAYMVHVDDVYVTDAYHSLSIEGYRVSAELIEKVRSGNWNPDDEADLSHRDALAARGYYQAFQAIKESVELVLKGANPGDVVSKHHGSWYRELFAPSVVAGILNTSDLAGYRNAPVYIRGSMHVPPRKEAVRDLMPAFMELLQEEKNAAVRVVLGHFVFVYIHPYLDGNGRTGRFLMNVMLASGGYPWTIVPVSKRDDYMAALEEASTHNNIGPLASFIGNLVEGAMAGTQSLDESGIT